MIAQTQTDSKAATIDTMRPGEWYYINSCRIMRQENGWMVIVLSTGNAKLCKTAAKARQFAGAAGGRS